MAALKKLWTLFTEGVRYYSCICPKGWWKRWPFLPLYSKKYVEFRLHTAYGMKHNWPRPKWREILPDIMRFLLWRRDYRRVSGPQSRK